MLKKFRLFIIIVILILIYLPGFAKLQELRQRLSETEKEIRRVKQQNALLEEKIAQMQTSPEYLEIVAREKMGVVKKGETVLKIIREGEEPPGAGNATATNTTNSKTQ